MPAITLVCQNTEGNADYHGDFMTWKRFSYQWPHASGIHLLVVDFPHERLWCFLLLAGKLLITQSSGRWSEKLWGSGDTTGMVSYSKFNSRGYCEENPLGITVTFFMGFNGNKRMGLYEVMILCWYSGNSYAFRMSLSCICWLSDPEFMGIICG